MGDVFKKFDLLTIHQIYTMSLGKLAFDVIKGTLPSDVPFPVELVKKRDGRRKTQFLPPKEKEDLSRRAVRYRLQKLWASLPSELRIFNSKKLQV